MEIKSWNQLAIFLIWITSLCEERNVEPSLCEAFLREIVPSFIVLPQNVQKRVLDRIVDGEIYEIPKIRNIVEKAAKNYKY